MNDPAPFPPSDATAADLPGIPAEGAIHALQAVCEAFEPTLPSHHEATAIIAGLLSEQMGFSQWERAVIGCAARLHDIGKVAISRQILGKETPLDEQDWSEIVHHPRIGAEIVGSLGTPLFLEAAALILSHHERWDGSGYPKKLAREQIPMGARIIAVADVYHSLTSWRAYKRGWSSGDARAEIAKLAGVTLDPAMVELFLSLHGEIKLPE